MEPDDFIEASLGASRVNLPKRQGKRSAARFWLDQKLLNGEHAHRMSVDSSEYCEGGDPECPLFGIQLREAMESWGA